MEHKLKKAVFAAGCFWRIEDSFRCVNGVKDVVSGYAGGYKADPTYREVSTGKTGHAESVEVAYDPRKVTFGGLIEEFWKMHDPTQANRQGPDIGSQYRSIIFYSDDAEKRQAEESKAALGKSGRFKKKIVTEIMPLAGFYPAEEYHQRYLEKNGQAICILAVKK